jgi:uncharacterized protein (TIGR03437 family)
MKTIIACFSLALGVASAATQAFTAHYVDIGLTGQSAALALDSSGNIFVVSTATHASGRAVIRVTKLDSSGNTLAKFDFGGTGTDTPKAIATDAQGNVFVAGITTSTDFPITVTLAPATGRRAFIAKLDANLTKVAASTELGGTIESPDSFPTEPYSVVLDSAGNVYVAGETPVQDFPVTAGAYQTTPSGLTNGFLVELPNGLNKLIVATYLGPQFVRAMALAPDGSILLTGVAGGNLPVTPGAYAQNCNCGMAAAVGFVSKLAPGARSITWATYLPAAPSSGPPTQYMLPAAIALDPTGNVVVAGTTSVGIPLTPGAIQTVLRGYTDGFVTKLDSLGENLLVGTYFGAGDTDTSDVTGAAIDISGTIWITGTSGLSLLPGGPSQSDATVSFVAGLSGDGTQVEALYPAMLNAADAAVVSSPAGAIVLGSNGSLLLPASTSVPSLLDIGNSANFTVSGVVAPAELVTLYGLNLGPAAAIQAQVSGNAITSSLGGYQLLFNGVPAPLLYLAANQINAVVPLEVADYDTATLELVTPSGTVPLTTLFVAPAQPAIFHDVVTGDVLAVNQDGTINSHVHPAPRGSIVAVWATGTGIGPLVPSNADGAVFQTCALCLFPETLAIVLNFNGVSAQTTYAGIAPGMVFGAAQVNFLVPMQGTTYGLQLAVGSAISGEVNIYVSY